MDAPAVVLPAFPPRFFNPRELDILCALIGSVFPEVVIEFGCNEGRAAATILKNVKTIRKYIGIDVFPGYQTINAVQRHEVPTYPGKFAAEDSRFHLILSGQGAFDLDAEDLRPCNAAFIDADHSKQGVLNDYALARSLVQPGGIIIFHDDNGLPVVQVSETLDYLAAGTGADIVHVDNTWIAFERVV